MLSKSIDAIQSIQIETTSHCDLDCVTCLKPAYRHVWREREMNKALFDLILSQLPDKVSIHLQGGGEPLLYPDTLSHVRQLKATGAIVSFTTNGTFMDTILAESLVDSGLDGLTFVQHTSLADIWEQREYRQFRDTFRKRKDYHDRKLSKISYSLAGSAELDAAVEAITHYFSKHPPPQSCASCAKLDGY